MKNNGKLQVLLNIKAERDRIFELKPLNHFRTAINIFYGDIWVDLIYLPGIYISFVIF